ncbi:ribosomal-processing cysteine protease Prp [Fictibacillus sp. WQ 8-8]|uniref:ribosomal-processing cysteine protease Prp n=1 Tax=Fictibacillus sp. WQ 8-8 TaxID=2938788 RepID=UPI00210E85FF|nr:ribosomal-processing cysteine protease Prp [Fictibacillus sp. WQ 8-8]MCQ6266426.1 ribosomal-processing cysteine protease Prp [Fictibacillus sp. WQ 8-8]
MIKVTIYRDEQHHIRSFSMSGHADSGPYGQDLVCAGASAVSFGAINAMEVLCSITPDVETQQDGGYLIFRAPDHLEDHIHEKVQLLLEGMVVSLKTIENDYGRFISLQEKQA